MRVHLGIGKYRTLVLMQNSSGLDYKNMSESGSADHHNCKTQIPNNCFQDSKDRMVFYNSYFFWCICTMEY